MTKATLVFAALLLVPTLANSSTEQAPAKPSITAQQFVKSYVKAMNRSDVGGMMKMFSKRTGVSAIGDGTISHGWGSIKTDAQELVGRQGMFKFTVGHVEVTQLGGGHVLAVAPFTVETLNQEEDIELPAAMTLVLERDGRSWKVLHEHWSVKDTEETGDILLPEDQGDGSFESPDGPGPEDSEPRPDLT